MAFFECEFPRNISFRSSGGPGWSTSINSGFSGQEFRNKNWTRSRGQWKIDLKTSPKFVGNEQAYADALRGFFMVTGGPADGFRLWDPTDHDASGPLAVIPGTSNLQWQLQRQIAIGGRTYTEAIYKPVWHTVADFSGSALTDEVEIFGTSLSWTLDPTTGIVTFPSDPGVTPTADLQFHYPVRFDSDTLAMIGQESYVRGGHLVINVQSLGLLEVKGPNF